MLAKVPVEIVSVLFHQSIEDLSVEVIRLSALPQVGRIARLLAGRVAGDAAYETRRTRFRRRSTLPSIGMVI